MSNPPEIWVKVCRELEKVITPDALHRWFSSIVPISYEAGRLVLGVENAIYQYWIEENYLNQLRECATLAVGREVKIVLMLWAQKTVQLLVQKSISFKQKEKKSRSPYRASW